MQNGQAIGGSAILAQAADYRSGYRASNHQMVLGKELIRRQTFPRCSGSPDGAKNWRNGTSTSKTDSTRALVFAISFRPPCDDHLRPPPVD
jgi:hypothetical protein